MKFIFTKSPNLNKKKMWGGGGGGGGEWVSGGSGRLE